MEYSKFCSSISDTSRTDIRGMTITPCYMPYHTCANSICMRNMILLILLGWKSTSRSGGTIRGGIKLLGALQGWSFWAEHIRNFTSTTTDYPLC